LIGAVGAGLSADKFGRKMPIWIACLVFVIGSVLQAAAYSIAQFAVGRFVVGLAVGAAAMVVPLYSKPLGQFSSGIRSTDRFTS
jgi:MFS transporter, SP family, solute carrier family 2 (myo-inositol transporter), member 13